MPIFVPILILLLLMSVFAYASFIFGVVPRQILSRFNFTKSQQVSIKIWLVILLPILVLLISRFLAGGLFQDVVNAGNVNYLPHPLTLTLVLFVLMSSWWGICLLPDTLFQIFAKKRKNLGLMLKLDAVVLLVTMLGFLATGLFGWQLFSSLFDQPEAERFFVLNAAIKNTCFIDPKRVGCPHNLSELSYIEPVQFAKAAKSTQMLYQYYPADNQYTFIVRYNRTHAVIFDWRLVKTDGVDFREVTIHPTPFGADRIEDPPEFTGPWNNLPKWNLKTYAN